MPELPSICASKCIGFEQKIGWGAGVLSIGWDTGIIEALDCVCVWRSSPSSITVPQGPEERRGCYGNKLNFRNGAFSLYVCPSPCYPSLPYLNHTSNNDWREEREESERQYSHAADVRDLHCVSLIYFKDGDPFWNFTTSGLWYKLWGSCFSPFFWLVNV